MPNDWLKNELLKLESVYQSGNLGALKDAVFWCKHYQQPLPEWANLAIFENISALAAGNKKIIGKWKAWLSQYKQDMSDYEIYSLHDEARNHGGAEWKDIFSIIGSILSNKLDDEAGHPKDETLRKARKRVIGQMKENPYRYYRLETFKKRNDCHPYRKDLWTSIKTTIKAGKPKGIKNR